MISITEQAKIPFDAANPLLYFKPNELGSEHAIAPNPTIGTRATPVKLVDISFPDGLARTLTICFSNPAQPTAAGTFQVRGPLVGIVEWGTGGANNHIECNIPPSNVFGPNGAAAGVADRLIQGSNGVNLTLAGSSFQVLARNDQNLNPANGPFGAAGAIIGSVVDAIIPRVGAFVSQWNLTKQNGPIQRVFPVVALLGTALAPGASVSIAIPQFAKRVRFQRQPLATTPLGVIVPTAYDFSSSLYAIPVNSVGPIELSPYDQLVTIRNDGAVNIISMIATFDLEV